MNELHSLPESLRSQIKSVAESLIPKGNASSLPLVEQVLIEIAAKNPELFAVLVLAKSGISALEFVETVQETQDMVVTEFFPGYGTYQRLKPCTTTTTKTRLVRLVKK